MDQASLGFYIKVQFPEKEEALRLLSTFLDATVKTDVSLGTGYSLTTLLTQGSKLLDHRLYLLDQQLDRLDHRLDRLDQLYPRLDQLGHY